MSNSNEEELTAYQKKILYMRDYNKTEKRKEITRVAVLKHYYNNHEKMKQKKCEQRANNIKNKKYYCDLCDIACPCNTHLNIHKATNKHKKNVEKMKEIEN